MSTWFETSKYQDPSKLKKIQFHNIKSKDRYGWTALMHAASTNNVQNIQFLLDAEKNIHTPTNYTALMIAVENGHSLAAKHLLCQAGVRVASGDAKYKQGTTALAIAVESQNIELFNVLLPFEKEAADWTDLHVFAFQHLNNSINTANFQLHYRQDGLGRLPLVYAVIMQSSQQCTHDYEETIHKMCSYQIQQKYPIYDKYGLTALHYAVLFNNLDSVRILCKYYAGYGTNQNCKIYKMNTTALMMAVNEENVEIAKVLTQYEQQNVDADNETAVQQLEKSMKLSSSQRQQQLLNMLKSTGGNNDFASRVDDLIKKLNYKNKTQFLNEIEKDKTSAEYQNIIQQLVDKIIQQENQFGQLDQQYQQFQQKQQQMSIFSVVAPNVEKSVQLSPKIDFNVKQELHLLTNSQELDINHLNSMQRYVQQPQAFNKSQITEPAIFQMNEPETVSQLKNQIEALTIQLTEISQKHEASNSQNDQYKQQIQNYQNQIPQLNQLINQQRQQIYDFENFKYRNSIKDEQISNQLEGQRNSIYLLENKIYNEQQEQYQTEINQLEELCSKNELQDLQIQNLQILNEDITFENQVLKVQVEKLQQREQDQQNTQQLQDKLLNQQFEIEQLQKICNILQKERDEFCQNLFQQKELQKQQEGEIILLTQQNQVQEQQLAQQLKQSIVIKESEDLCQQMDNQLTQQNGEQEPGEVSIQQLLKSQQMQTTSQVTVDQQDQVNELKAQLQQVEEEKQKFMVDYDQTQEQLIQLQVEYAEIQQVSEEQKCDLEHYKAVYDDAQQQNDLLRDDNYELSLAKENALQLIAKLNEDKELLVQEFNDVKYEVLQLKRQVECLNLNDSQAKQELMECRSKLSKKEAQLKIFRENISGWMGKILE